MMEKSIRHWFRFQNGTTHIVYFESQMPVVTLDGLNMTGLSPGLQRVQLLKPDIQEPEMPGDVWTFEVTTPSVSSIQKR